MNVPDDWGSYYRNCSACGSRYHDSEGGCYCHEDRDPDAERQDPNWPH